MFRYLLSAFLRAAQRAFIKAESFFRAAGLICGRLAFFLAAGLAEAFFAAGISYPPFHSAVAEDKKLISFLFA